MDRRGNSRDEVDDRRLRRAIVPGFQHRQPAPDAASAILAKLKVLEVQIQDGMAELEEMLK